jgi:hypothetical protein
MVWSKFFLGVQKSCHNISIFKIVLPNLFLPCKYTFMGDYDGL